MRLDHYNLFYPNERVVVTLGSFPEKICGNVLDVVRTVNGIVLYKIKLDREWLGLKVVHSSYEHVERLNK